MCVCVWVCVCVCVWVSMGECVHWHGEKEKERVFATRLPYFVVLNGGSNQVAIDLHSTNGFSNCSVVNL